MFSFFQAIETTPVINLIWYRGLMTYYFDQTTGVFSYESEMYNDPYTASLIEKANTSKNDLGPNRFFSSVDGYEYLILSSETENGDLDMFYLKNMPHTEQLFPR